MLFWDHQAWHTLFLCSSGSSKKLYPIILFNNTVRLKLSQWPNNLQFTIRGQHFYDSTSELTLQGAGESIYSIPNEDFGEGRKFSVDSTSANDETLRTRHKSVTDELKSTLVPSSDPDTAVQV